VHYAEGCVGVPIFKMATERWEILSVPQFLLRDRRALAASAATGPLSWSRPRNVEFQDGHKSYLG
jgi:hypothetical protein